MKKVKQDIILKGLDASLPTLRAAEHAVRNRPTSGWLRAVRNGLGLTQKSVALKAGAKQQTVPQWEKRENRRTITLESLERAANAMDCDLVYFLTPKLAIAKSFTDLAKQRNFHELQRRATEHSMILEGQAVSSAFASETADAVVIRKSDSTTTPKSNPGPSQPT